MLGKLSKTAVVLKWDLPSYIMGARTLTIIIRVVSFRKVSL